MVLFKKQKPINYFIYSAIILVGIFIDQLSKFLISSNMTLNEDIPESIPLIKGFLHITYTTNDGIAFGMMDDPSQRWIFLLVSTIGILAFVVYLYLGHAENMLYGVAISMVISGGIGNMIDRLGFGFYINPETGNGEVIDFIDFCGIWNAIFNGADSFVCIGAGLLILALVLDLIKEYKEEAAKKAEAAGADSDKVENRETEEGKTDGTIGTENSEDK